MTALVMSGVVLVANVLGAGMAYPQVRKLVRTRRTDGVSTVWVGISIAMNAWWLAYGVAASVWALVPVCIISLALYVTLAAVMLRTLGRRAVPGLAAGVLVPAAVPVPFLALDGWALAGAVIGLGYGAQLLPAVVTAFRSSDLRGVAVGTWVIALVEAGLWLLYGTHVADPALLVGGIAGSLMAALILARLAVARGRPFRPAWAPA